MGLFDFLFRWKVISDQDRDIDEEDELMDMMYIMEDMENNEENNKKKDK